MSRYRRKSFVNFMRQSVAVTGLGTTAFDDAIQSILAIEDVFARQVGEKKMVPWKRGTYQEWDSMDISNRYFTHRRTDRNIQPVPFDRLVDPDGTLEALAGEDKVHGMDNVVEYYELNQDKK
jgi:hypothetical protein